MSNLALYSRLLKAHAVTGGCAALLCGLVSQGCSSANSPDGTSTTSQGGAGQGGATASTTATSSTSSVTAGSGNTGSGSGGASGSGTGYSKLPCNVTVGNGSGTLTIDATTGNSGDVICVTAGSYSQGSITGVSNRTIQNDGGLVTLTGPISIENLSNVIFNGAGDDAITYGFQLNGGAASFVLTGPNSGLDMHQLEAIDAGIFLDAGHTGLTYNGDPSGLVLYQTVIDHRPHHRFAPLISARLDLLTMLG